MREATPRWHSVQLLPVRSRAHLHNLGAQSGWSPPQSLARHAQWIWSLRHASRKALAATQTLTPDIPLATRQSHPPGLAPDATHATSRGQHAKQTSRVLQRLGRLRLLDQTHTPRACGRASSTLRLLSKLRLRTAVASMLRFEPAAPRTHPTPGQAGFASATSASLHIEPRPHRLFI